MLLPQIRGQRCQRFGFEADGSNVGVELVRAHLREVLGPGPSHPGEETANRPNPQTERENVSHGDRAPLWSPGGSVYPATRLGSRATNRTPTASPTPGSLSLDYSTPSLRDARRDRVVSAHLDDRPFTAAYLS